MKKIIATFVFGLSVIPTSSDACLSGEDLARLRAKNEQAKAAGCSDSLVVPGSSIGAVYLDAKTEDAARLTKAGIGFDSDGGRVSKIRWTGSNACVSQDWLAPLRIIDAKSDIAPFADCARAADGRSAVCPFEGVALFRTTAGVRVEVTRPVAASPS